MQTVYGPEMKLVKVDGAGRTGQWAPHFSR
jgi:hypothetical protein